MNTKNGSLEKFIWDSDLEPVYKSRRTGYRICEVNEKYVALKGWNGGSSDDIIHIGTKDTIHDAFDAILLHNGIKVGSE